MANKKKKHSQAFGGEQAIPISALAPDPDNPREMKSDKRAGLSASLLAFGPLDIVFNRRTGQLVSGHQRVGILREAGATEVVCENDWAYIVHPKTGDKFVVRLVDWDVEQQRLANLTANNSNIQGEWTPAALEQLSCLGEHVLFQDLQLDALNSDLLAVFTPAGAGDAPGSEDQSGALNESWQIVVTCTSEGHQRKLLNRFEAEGLQCRALI